MRTLAGTPSATILPEAWGKRDAVVGQNINLSPTDNNKERHFLCKTNKNVKNQTIEGAVEICL